MWKILITFGHQNLESLNKYKNLHFFLLQWSSAQESRTNLCDELTIIYIMLLIDAYYELVAACR